MSFSKLWDPSVWEILDPPLRTELYCLYLTGREIPFCRYDGTTGRFTVPTGKAGLYYFYTDLYTNDPQNLYFAIRVNQQFLCRAILDISTEGPDDNGSPSCGAIALLTEGIKYHLSNFLSCICNGCAGPAGISEILEALPVTPANGSGDDAF